MAKKVSNAVMHTLNFGSFPGKIMFTCGYTYDEICKELKKQKCDEWLQCFETTKNLFHPDCAGFSATRRLTVKGKEYEYNFLHLRDCFDYSEKAHATLAHEVIHSVTYQLSTMLDIVKENEAFAYTHTHIMNQCYEVLKIKTKKRIVRA